MKTLHLLTITTAGILHLSLTPLAAGAAGDVDLSFDPGSGVNGTVHAIVLQPDGKVLTGNAMTFINGTNQYATTRLNADGTLDGSFVSGVFNPDLQTMDSCDPGYQCYAVPNATSALLVQSDEKVILGGDYIWVSCHEESCTYTSRTFLARFHANGSRDITFTANIDLSVATLAGQLDDKIVIGGDFQSVGGGSRNGIARINPDGGLDHSFNPGTGVDGAVLAIRLQPDGKIIIGGTFTTVNETSRNGIARLNSNGSLDGSFNPGTGANSRVNSAVVQPDGKVLIGGPFTSVNGINRNGIARLNSDGSLDNSFNPGTGANGSVLSIALQTDGNILIGGDFTAVNGVARPQIARLVGDSPSPATFAGWAAGFGLFGAAAAAGADPDGDGLSSGAEYILGGNPAVPAFSARPAATLVGGNLVFTFPRADASETPDVNLVVETSTDLVTWPTAFNIGTDTAASSAGVSLTENGAAPDTISVAIPLGTDKAKFARLKVTVAP